MKNILLTGATGFLGSALARYWIGAGYQVSALLRPTSSCARIEDLLPSIQLFRCAGDDQILSAVTSIAPDYIVHTACAYGRAGESILQIFDANVRFGLLLLEGASELGKKVAFVNTGTILDPAVSSYALTKHSFSTLGLSQARQGRGDVKFINVALQHMYGPGDDRNKFTTHVIRSCLTNIKELNLTSGEQKRDFIFIDDVVSAYDTILSEVVNIADAEEIAVGSGDAPRVRVFVELVHAMVKSSTQLNFGAIPYRNNEAMLFQADISRMRSLGWEPETSLQDGLQKTIEKDNLQ